MSAFAEAPASWNVRYRTPEGFDAMLTLRGASGEDVLPRAERAIVWLQEHGCEPTTGHGGNDNGYKEDEQEPDTKVCPIHHVAMKRREKQGDVWWSHKAVDPSTGAEYWCRGKRE